jgi:hypothetical protein
MADTLQPVLWCDQQSASDITVFLSDGGTTYEVYLGVALLERVGADPESVARKMLVGRLYNADRTLVELGERFGHDHRTIKKWGAALRSGDIEQIARAFAGRQGRRKTSPELMRYAWQLYRERERLGRNYRAIIIEKIVEVFGVRLSTTAASQLFAADPQRQAEPFAADPPRQAEPSAAELPCQAEPFAPGPEAPDGDRIDDAGAAPEWATGLPNAPSPASATAASVKQSPRSLPVQGERLPGGRQWVHHAGLALFAHELAGIADPLERQVIGQILQGAVNVEQSKTLCLRSLAQFTGPVVTGLKKQREGLDRLAGEAELMAVYARNAELLVDGPNRGDLFYFDSHTKEYTGQLKVLKGWCGRLHGVVKAVNLDVFHTRSGRPCFIGHYSPYDDLRERFFLSRARFDRLFDPDRRQGRTFVIDRGIYSLPVLQSFAPDYVITWEKGYQGGDWDEQAPTVRFTRSRPRNRHDDLIEVHFECQEAPWRRDRAFRRLLVRLRRQGEAPIELSVLASPPDMDRQDIVWAICSRWLQENDFKYLDTHFGIDQLDSRASSTFAERAGDFADRPVDSPEYRDLKADIQTLESHLAKDLLKLHKTDQQARQLDAARTLLDARGERLHARLTASRDALVHHRRRPRDAARLDDDLKQFNRDCRQLDRQRRHDTYRQALQAQIADTEARLEPLEASLCSAIRTQSRRQLLIDGDYRLLDTRRKSILDALRVTAANTFRNVQERYRAICDNFRDDHDLVRLLSRCSGIVEQTDRDVTITLWLPGTLQAHRLHDMTTLLDQLQEQINAAVPAPRDLHLRLASGPQPH